MNQFEENSYMKTLLVTGAKGTFLDLNEVKAHLKIDHTTEDSLIQSLLIAAIGQVENITNRRLLTQTWKAYADTWPANFFTMPFGNLQSVTAVKYTDEDNDQSTLAATEYIVDTVSDPGRVMLGVNKEWPNDTLYPVNPIEIEFVCGYGVDPNFMPEVLKVAAMIMIGDMYTNRESFLLGPYYKYAEIPDYVISMLQPYRLFNRS